MAIDQVVFKNAWVLLCERFNRTLSSVLAKAYYNSLSPRMTTEQFQTACQRVFDEHEFFPRPSDFFDDPQQTQAQALDQWELVHDMMRGFGDKALLTDEARRVVALLGGESALRATKLDALPFVRRDFLQLYGEAAAIARREAGARIAATPHAPRVAAGSMKLPGPQKLAIDLDALGGT